MKMRSVILLSLLTPAFASVHYASRTTAPTAQLAYSGVKHAAKLAVYPIRHSRKTARGVKKGVTSAVKMVF